MPFMIDAIEAENDDDGITSIETEDVFIPYKLDTVTQMDILLLNADVIWTQQFDHKSEEPVQKHVNNLSVSKELLQNKTPLSC